MNTLKYLNSLCILLVSSILIGALYFQFGLHEDPCPLCLLQRMAMIGVIFGLALNSFFGFHPKHFAIVIFSAIVGFAFAGRQVLLHICGVDGDLGYGTPVLGVHLYSWSAVIFTACIIGSSTFLFFSDSFKTGAAHVVLKFEKYVFYLATLIIVINVVAAFFECQLGPCCEDGPCP